MRITPTMPPQQIARILARYCDDRDIPHSRFGRDTVNDPRLIFDLRAGRKPRPKTLDRINTAIVEALV